MLGSPIACGSAIGDFSQIYSRQKSSCTLVPLLQYRRPPCPLDRGLLSDQSAHLIEIRNPRRFALQFFILLLKFLSHTIQEAAIWRRVQNPLSPLYRNAIASKLDRGLKLGTTANVIRRFRNVLPSNIALAVFLFFLRIRKIDFLLHIVNRTFHRFYSRSILK